MTKPPVHLDVIEFSDDLSLLEAYPHNAIKTAGPVPEALVVEIERGNLDI